MHKLKLILLVSIHLTFYQVKSEPIVNDYITTSKFNSKLKSYLSAIKQKKGFSGEVLVGQGGSILFQESVGMASQEHQLTLSMGAKYKVASISKTFTAALILMAEQDNMLNVNDKLAKYLPRLSKRLQVITIAQLLSHTSGLPHNEGIKDYWLVKSKLALSDSQILEEINQLNLLYKPGAEMSYSSLAYVLLSYVLETIHSQNMESILKTHILIPLQMHETGVLDNTEVISGMASGYHMVNSEHLMAAPYRNYAMLKGAGDMYSTTTDLLKWARSIYNHQLFNNPQMFKSQNFGLKKPQDESYGYGWFLNTDNETPKYYHGGGTWGYTSHLALYPDDEISIIILSNVSSLPISAIAIDIENIVFNQPVQIPVIDQEIKIDSKRLESYVGLYMTKSEGEQLRVFKVEEALLMQLGNNPAFKIYAKTNDQFFGKKIELEVKFERSGDKVVGLRADRKGQTYHFVKTQQP